MALHVWREFSNLYPRFEYEGRGRGVIRSEENTEQSVSEKDERTKGMYMVRTVCIPVQYLKVSTRAPAETVTAPVATPNALIAWRIASGDAGCLGLDFERVLAVAELNGKVGDLNEGNEVEGAVVVVNCCLRRAEGEIPLGRRCRALGTDEEAAPLERLLAITSGTARPIVKNT